MDSPDPVLKPKSIKPHDDAAVQVFGRALRALRVAWPALLIIQILSGPTAWAARRHEFGGPEATRHFTRPRTFDITHVVLEVSFDVKQELLYGRATTSLTPLNDSLTAVTLDAAELHIDSVFLVSGEPLAARSADDRITIQLDRPYSATDTIAFTIVYSVRPRLGVYFVHPDKGYPDKPVEIWSQGEMEESHH